MSLTGRLITPPRLDCTTGYGGGFFFGKAKRNVVHAKTVSKPAPPLSVVVLSGSTCKRMHGRSSFRCV
jgi:hypothetical protein